MDSVLVLDIGSSSTRAMLFDERAVLFPGAIARAAFDFRVGSDGASEDDPVLAFQRVVAVLDELQSISSSQSVSISGGGISAYASSLLCLDENGAPLTPVFTYADTRSAGDARVLRDQVDELAVLQRTGCRVRANYLPSRIAWIRRSMPRVFSATRWFVSLSDYISLRLFGDMHAGLSVWSWSGLVNRETQVWDEAWLDHLGISADQLPSITPNGHWMEGLRSEYAERWPILRNVRWLPAVGDGAAANIGSGCVDDRHVAVTIGTTAAMRIVRDSQPCAVPDTLWCYRVDHGRDLIGGATTEGGNVFAWLRRSLNLAESPVLEESMRQMQPDAHHLSILPFFAGERSPGFSEDSRATIHGLTLDTEPAEIARACLEAIAYRLGMIHESLRTTARPDATLIASGGALLASPTWCQIIADVTGTPLRICNEPEATGRGIAFLVLERLQNPVVHAELIRTTRLGVTYEPDPLRHQLYRDAMARQQELYARLV
jgi:gluconokinase